MISQKRIAVVGTGANGASAAADFTRAGLDVTLIDQWPAHVEAMRRDGIKVQYPDRVEVTRVRALHLCDIATLRHPFDIVFIVVKAYDTRWVAELIMPLLAPDTLVIGLQNGMTVADTANVVGAYRTLGAVIEIASNMCEPGVVNRENGPDTTWFAVGGIEPRAHARAAEVAEVLSHAGQVEVSDDILASKWMKLIVNAAELVPSAILGLPLAQAAAVPGMYDFMLACGTEAVRTAVAADVALRPILGMHDPDPADPDGFAADLFEEVLRRFTLPDTLTTCLQDWQKGRRNEVHELNGHVAEEARRVGVRAPLNEWVVELAESVERGELALSPANADLLLSRGPREVLS